MSTILSYEQRHICQHPGGYELAKIIEERLNLRPTGISDNVDTVSFVFTHSLSGSERAVINDIMEGYGFNLI